MKSVFLIYLFLLSLFQANAAETNAFFINDRGHGEFMDSKNIQTARKSQESLPAKNFPEGNWGEITNGFQLSLRFEKQTFTNKEPIIAVVLLRNVTNADVYLSYSCLPAGYSDGPISFRVVSDAGVILPQRKYESYGNVNGALPTLFASTQAKFSERVDKRFEMKNGTYSIQAFTTGWSAPPLKFESGNIVFSNSVSTIVEVKSAEVQIKIND